MRIAVWTPPHEIADEIALAMWVGLQKAIGDTRHDENNKVTYWQTGFQTFINYIPDDATIKEFDLHICYGILRGAADLFRACDRLNVPWFNVDRGFWGAGHFSGLYRINYRGTQSPYNAELQKPHTLSLQYPEVNTGDVVLIVPPSEYVKQFFGLNKYGWLVDAINKYGRTDRYIVRTKGDNKEIDWKKIKGVVTFNSTLGVEALKRGVPVISDTEHSMIGSYYKKVLVEKGVDYNFENVMSVSREELFRCMSAHQFTLEEIREGKAWELLQHYLRPTS